MFRTLTLALCTAPLLVAAQLPIGGRNITFIDASRGGRQIPCEVYYPAATAGNNTAVAAGNFPILAFGHGFAMGVGAYANLWQALVPEGYIMVLPTTEGGLLPSPSHGDFGLDLAFAIASMQGEGADPGSAFFGHVASTAAVMGHSMGGGASFLAAAGSPLVTTVVNFAPAETNPSAIAAAANVQVPTLVLAGSQDCVTPPATNQLPMYNAVPAGCKAYVQLTGGGHCNFANYNFNCSFGELTCGGAGSLGRPTQQTLAQQYTLLWLDRYLKDDAQAGADLETLLIAGQGITAQSVFTDCPPIVVRLAVKALLDGPYDEGTDLMIDSLRSRSLLPITEPNTTAGFVHIGVGLGEVLDPTLLAITGTDAVVDWVFLELRDATTGTLLLATANGLVQRDGDIISPQGEVPVFPADPGNYRVVVRHRNHLGVMTDGSFALSREPVALDLSDPALNTFGTEARRLRDGRALLWTGNAVFNDELRYTGAANDRDAMLQRIGGVVPTVTAIGYLPEDVTFDGVVRYAGLGNDRDRLLQSIGGALPTAVRTEQLP